MRWNKEVIYGASDVKQYLELRTMRGVKGLLSDEYIK
jgi:hypothetical protein